MIKSIDDLFKMDDEQRKTFWDAQKAILTDSLHQQNELMLRAYFESLHPKPSYTFKGFDGIFGEPVRKITQENIELKKRIVLDLDGIPVYMVATEKYDYGFFCTILYLEEVNVVLLDGTYVSYGTLSEIEESVRFALAQKAQDVSDRISELEAELITLLRFVDKKKTDDQQ